MQPAKRWAWRWWLPELDAPSWERQWYHWQAMRLIYYLSAHEGLRRGRDLGLVRWAGLGGIVHPAFTEQVPVLRCAQWL